MKKLFLLTLTLIICCTTYAQVGINTVRPGATLDVEGTIRIADTGGMTMDGDSVTATKIVGIDNQGNIVALTTDENLYLENNVIKTLERSVEMGSIPPFNVVNASDVSLIIWPGGANGSKSVIRIENTAGNLNITGFDVSALGGPAAAHGTTVWLYPVDGWIRLRNEDTSSLPENRIAVPSHTIIAQYSMARIVYDGILERWVVMSRGN